MSGEITGISHEMPDTEKISGAKWTPEQLEAITRRGCNLLVAAAAGAGKTAVLVERIIRKIIDDEDPVDIDRLLVVTFTNAAATEMKERIGDALAKLLERYPGSARIHRQLMYLNKASITTIHSFCLEVIKNNFQCADLDPDFRVADETEATLLKLETLEELFEEKYETENPDSLFFKLLECYGRGRDDKGLKNIIIKLYDFVQSNPWPLAWLKEQTEAFNLPEETDFATTSWGKSIINSVYIDLAGFVEMAGKALEISGYAEGLAPYYSCICDDVENLEKLRDKCLTSSWDELCESFNNFKFGKLSRCGKDADKAAQEQVKALRETVKKGIKRISEQYFALTSSDIARDLRELYPLLKCLSGLVAEFMEKYSLKKRSRSVLDFNDLEHFCLEILVETDENGNKRPTETALALRKKYNEIMIDEYQDSNLVQEVILRTISREDEGTPNIFMVGDVKQSIYRFRQARPELFMEKYLGYSYGGEAGQSKNVKILLYKNFRSRETIVKGVNYIFSQIMSRYIGEVDYNREEALNFGAIYPPADNEEYTDRKIELNIIETEDSSNLDVNIMSLNQVTEREDSATDQDFHADLPEDEDLTDDTDLAGDMMEDEPFQEEERLDNIQLEARLVGKRINELIKSNFEVFDNGLNKYRKVRYRDIVILLRTTKNWAEVFMEEMESMGIPVFADTGTGYFKTVEVQTIMSLLQVIDNPLQDIPFLTVLRSPIGMFKPEELAEIRLADKNSTIYEAMKKYCEVGDETGGLLKKKARSFLERLESWRDKALHLSTDELIWYLYTDTGYYNFVGTLPGGEVRQANLRILFERARQYEETSYKGLFNFVNFVDRLKSRGGDFGSAMILGENENLVRIMSIHKSKGLEFPVVILSGCGKVFNFQDTRDKILLHQDLGFGPDYIDTGLRIYYSTIPKQAIMSKIKLETLSEEMRLLYVALTRAREKLIITGYVNNINKTAARWANALEGEKDKLPVYMISRARCFLDWIGPAVIKHPDSKVLLEVAAGDAANVTLGKATAVNGNNQQEDSALWDIKLWERDNVLSPAEESEPDDKVTDSDGEVTPDNTFYEEINRRLSWEYPYKILSGIPAKVSVTELKRIAYGDETENYDRMQLINPTVMKKPLFLQETKGLSAVEKGTVLHFVMQHLDLERVDSKEDIRKQIDSMVSSEFITRQQADTVDVNKILKFFNSSLGKRMRSAGVIKREVPFNLEISAEELVPALKDSNSAGLPEAKTNLSEGENNILKSETVILQGIVDCYFEEEGEIVLLEYKTDYVADDDFRDIKEKYRGQLEFYQKALERITGKKVKEKFMYIFSKNTAIKY